MDDFDVYKDRILCRKGEDLYPVHSYTQTGFCNIKSIILSEFNLYCVYEFLSFVIDVFETTFFGFPIDLFTPL